MKKTLKKLFKSILITTVTLLSGFGITSISFNLFGTLTSNEMKLFLAIDIIILVFVGGVFYYIDEKQSKRKKKEMEFQKRHLQRVEESFREYEGLDMAKIYSGTAEYVA